MEWEVYAQSKQCDHSAPASAAMRQKVRGDNGSAAAQWSSTEDQNSEARIVEISVRRGPQGLLVKDGCRDRDSVRAAADGSLPFKTQK